LEACRGFTSGKITKDRLIAETVRRGFNNVIDAFHVVNGSNVPHRFFIDRRKDSTPARRDVGLSPGSAIRVSRSGGTRASTHRPPQGLDELDVPDAPLSPVEGFLRIICSLHVEAS
jgi:hypothetical protein